jgi:hypothetical protein
VVSMAESVGTALLKSQFSGSAFEKHITLRLRQTSAMPG